MHFNYFHVPVSYTHLTHNSRYFWPHSCLFSYICTLFKWKVLSPYPVSYTHLDVYKRQVEGKRQFTCNGFFYQGKFFIDVCYQTLYCATLICMTFHASFRSKLRKDLFSLPAPFYQRIVAFHYGRVCHLCSLSNLITIYYNSYNSLSCIPGIVPGIVLRITIRTIR